MTAGSNGVPEDDDPFAYLYRPPDGGAAGAGADSAAPTVVQQPGVPRTSYAQPTQVGRAQYGQRPPTQPGYGPPAPQQPAPYAQHSRPQPEDHGGHGGHGGRAASRGVGGGNRGVLFGAIAVVAAIAVGASVAFMNGGDKNKDHAAGKASTGPTATTSQDSASPSVSPSASASTNQAADASALQVQNGAQATGVQGGASGDGKYVTLQQGTTLTWTVQAPSDGPWSLWVHYDNAGADATAAVSANGTAHPGGIGLKNYSPGQKPENSWYSSYAYPAIKAGPNTVVITCDNPSCAGVLVDKVVLTPQSVKKFPG